MKYRVMVHVEAVELPAYDNEAHDGDGIEFSNAITTRWVEAASPAAAGEGAIAHAHAELRERGLVRNDFEWRRRYKIEEIEELDGDYEIDGPGQGFVFYGVPTFWTKVRYSFGYPIRIALFALRLRGSIY